jgi:hypothetical protein
MYGFRIEAVGSTEDENLIMPKSESVREILKRLLSIYGSGPECDLSPKGEFSFRARRKSRDRIFRIRDFEGRNKKTFKGIEDDGGPGRGGIDLLGKYTLSDSTVTIYVDSCRKVVGRRYPGVDSLEGLIEVVLIHELAHLCTRTKAMIQFTSGSTSLSARRTLTLAPIVRRIWKSLGSCHLASRSSIRLGRA